MDKVTVIALARQAGFVVDEVSQQHQPNCIFHTHHMVDELLERFAALVAAHEREECAKVVEAEQARVLGKQEGESWDAVNINIRMTAVLLPDIAAAIRSRT